MSERRSSVLRVSRIEARLNELGLVLPAPVAAPAGIAFNLTLVKVHRGIAYVSGHGPFDGSNVLVQGRVGRDLTLDEGYEAAQLVALSMLASLKQELGNLDRVTEWIRVTGYIYAEPDFARNAAVLNGFSDLIVELWGEAGKHARSAPGQASSPFDVPAFIEAIVAVD
jgi:enamine deaminase RidA (YjgF/YER057c/UK114 family)